ncbi:hypothetical protein [Photobacterium sp. TLY01]|uniref:hypothetical protein n=1 Tax=Photobacterium sp. TLY01 TaxID=2907534 RepID=UPI001F32D5D1|nr:hypothetical protein [Photobacterium sp. TLY01]UIP27226.1 hypothetical protein LN341_11350 [Photobacterium sp. TLY01]
MKRSNIILYSILILFSKLPFSFVFFFLSSIFSLLGKKLTIPKTFTHMFVTVFFLICLFTSGIHLLAYGSGLVSFVVATLFFIFCFISFRYDIVVYKGMLGGLLFVSLVSVFELILNIKLIGYLYPESFSQIDVITNNRFYVSSFFPNYNNFSFAMFFLNALILPCLFSRTFGFYLRLGLFFVFLYNLAICLHMGSRGFLISSLLYYLLFFYLRINSSSIRWCVVFIFFLLAISISPLAFSYLNDNSNLIRVRILYEYFSLYDSMEFYLGFGTLENYVSVMTATYGFELHDPHNLFVEVSIIYGFGAFVFLVLLYFYVVVFFLMRFKSGRNYEFSVYILPLFAFLPIIGAVPSSSLFYYQLQVLLLSLPMVVLNVRRQNLRSNGWIDS